MSGERLVLPPYIQGAGNNNTGGGSGGEGGISDAPNDGNLYGRKNQAWSQVPTIEQISYTAGDNITIENNVISANIPEQQNFVAGNGIDISNNVITNTAPAIPYTAGDGITIDDNVISATSSGNAVSPSNAGKNINIDENGVISLDNDLIDVGSVSTGALAVNGSRLDVVYQGQQTVQISSGTFNIYWTIWGAAVSVYVSITGFVSSGTYQFITWETLNIPGFNSNGDYARPGATYSVPALYINNGGSNSYLTGLGFTISPEGITLVAPSGLTDTTATISYHGNFNDTSAAVSL
ncbi:MAG: hypothetical protein LBH98_10110 [Chitinispirillales bacterium]|nr:hypothetical protein [Chitinispirillales bacterium]